MSNVIRAISENGGVIFCAIDSTEIVREMERIHQTSAVASAALGRLLTAASLMGVMLKNENNTVTLRVQGGGPTGQILAVGDGRGNVKGYVQNPVVELPLRQDGKLNVGEAVGSDGMLSVIEDLGLKQPYIGQVPLISGEIAEDITAYYAASKQIPTVCALGVLVGPDLHIVNAGGYLLQLMPGANEEEIALLERNVSAMPSMTQLLQKGKALTDIMELALEGFAPNVLDEADTVYLCDCDKARVERALLSLGRDELTDMLQEDTKAEITCQFCDTVYQVDLQALLETLTQQGR